VDVCVGEKKIMIEKIWNNRDSMNDIYLFVRNILGKKITKMNKISLSADFFIC